MVVVVAAGEKIKNKGIEMGKNKDGEGENR